MCRTFDRNFQQCQKWSLLRIEKLLYKSLVVALNFAATNLFQMEYACVIPAASFIAFGNSDHGLCNKIRDKSWRFAGGH
jgi:hypothetical protein